MTETTERKEALTDGTIPYYCRECCPARNREDLKNCGHESWFGKSIEDCQKHHEYHTEEYEQKLRRNPTPKLIGGYVYPDGYPEGRRS